MLCLLDLLTEGHMFKLLGMLEGGVLDFSPFEHSNTDLSYNLPLSHCHIILSSSVFIKSMHSLLQYMYTLIASSRYIQHIALLMKQL